MKPKIALVTFGNDEAYGLEYLANELYKDAYVIFVDGEKEVYLSNIDIVCFSPMTKFMKQAIEIAKEVKRANNRCFTVVGGHHVLCSSDTIYPFFDLACKTTSPIAKTAILSKTTGFIDALPTCISDIGNPRRFEYFRDIPRIRNKYRKVMLSRMGCFFDCSYCCSNVSNPSRPKQVYLKRRDMNDIIKEIEDIKQYPVEEIEWVDDDMFAGSDAESFLSDFVDVWDTHAKLPMYISTTSINALRINEKILQRLHPFISCVGVGVQSANSNTLKLFNRGWDSKEKIENAYNRLRNYRFSVNLQFIVGNPVSNPVDEAIETLEFVRKIAKGSIISCYPLQIYPGTKMLEYCIKNGFKLNKQADGDTSSGECGIMFDSITMNRLKNICKLATFIVKYDLPPEFYMTLLDYNLDDKTSKALSMLRYKYCMIDRLKEKGEQIFLETIKNMEIQH